MEFNLGNHLLENCVKLNSENQTMFWGNEYSNLTLDVHPIMWPPILTYADRLVKSGNSSILHYQWCGPLILIIREFAKQLNANVRFSAHIKDELEYFDYSINTPQEERAHLILFPSSPSIIVNTAETFGVKPSRHIGYMEKDSIFSKTKSSERSIFSLFACFDIEVYYSIILFMILISTLFAIKNRSVISFFNTFRIYFSVLYSDFYALKQKNSFSRLFFGIWLLMCTVLLAAFSGHLWDLLVRKQPIHKIDSWNDLHSKPEWKNVTIKAVKHMEFSNFVNNDDSEMARDFKRRTVTINPWDFLWEDKMDLTKHKKIFTGEEVLSIDGLLAHYLMKSTMLENFQLRDGYEYHVSESGAGMKPYFIFFNEKRFNSTLAKKLNSLISRLDESGIYEQAVKKSLKPKGFGPNIDEKIDTISYEFGPLDMIQMKGVFLSFMIAMNFVILIFIIELMTGYLQSIIDIIIGFKNCFNDLKERRIPSNRNRVIDCLGIVRNRMISFFRNKKRSIDHKLENFCNRKVEVHYNNLFRAQARHN